MRHLLRRLWSVKFEFYVVIAICGLIIMLVFLALDLNAVTNPDFLGGTAPYLGQVFSGISICCVGTFLAAQARGSERRSKHDQARQRLRSAEDELVNILSVGVSNSFIPGPEIIEDLTGMAQWRDQAEDLQHAKEDLLALSALWNVTNSRLELYHDIATGQAKSSFRTAQIAIGAGFILLTGFAILSFRTHNTASAITTGALGAVSAALAGYISKTFVRSQESAATHLRAYFDQPLEFSRYLAAERLLSGQQDLDPGQRAMMLRTVISAMVQKSTRNAFIADNEHNNGAESRQLCQQNI
jgi:hypothetical protein